MHNGHNLTLEQTKGTIIKMITTVTKKRVIRDFDKLGKSFKKKVLKSFPNGFNRDVITYLSVQGKTIAAIPYETEDTFYLLRLPSANPAARKTRTRYKEDYESWDDTETKENGYEKDDDDDDESIDENYSYNDFDKEDSAADLFE
jgi:phosphopantothenoylcysteine synthetase/decarboxylase